MTDNRGVTVTLKAHGGYDAPWVVFYGDTAADASARIQEAQAIGLFATIGNALGQFRAEAVVGDALGATPVTPPHVAQGGYTPGPAPQYRQAPSAPQSGYQAPSQGGGGGMPPGVTPPQCPHGTKRYVEGRFGPFWGCPAERNDPSQCKPEKFR